MLSTFWTNTIWFLLLSVTTIIELIFVFAKAKNRKHALAVYFTLTGIVLLIENIILSRFLAYQYFPMFFPKSPTEDSATGNFFLTIFFSGNRIISGGL
jgi:hypothetical protein